MLNKRKASKQIRTQRAQSIGMEMGGWKFLARWKLTKKRRKKKKLKRMTATTTIRTGHGPKGWPRNDVKRVVRVAGEQPSDCLLKIFTAIYLHKPHSNSFSHFPSLFFSLCLCRVYLLCACCWHLVCFASFCWLSALIIFDHLFINKCKRNEEILKSTRKCENKRKSRKSICQMKMAKFSTKKNLKY